MSKKMISAILQEAASQKDPNLKVQCLRFYDCFALKTVLQGFFHPNVKFALPEGPLPEGFSFSQFDEPLRLHSDAKKLYLFVEGGSPMAQHRREQVFLDFVGGLNKAEGELMVAMKDKKFPYKGLTAKHVEEAFPGLLG
jgi:hypothetical protein